MIERIHLQQLIKRIYEPRRFLQVIMGPRQVGKTTLASQLIKKIHTPKDMGPSIIHLLSFVKYEDLYYIFPEASCGVSVRGCAVVAVHSTPDPIQFS